MFLVGSNFETPTSSMGGIALVFCGFPLSRNFMDARKILQKGENFPDVRH
jgi:hypothetical protein